MAGQDIKKRLLPGQSQPIQVGGDFIYMKLADRPITVIINGGESSGSRVVMEAGDKYRPGNFKSFEIENTDPKRPAQITMTVGRGDYNRQIIQGELVVDPRIKTATGEYVADTRANHKVMVQVDYKRTPEITAGSGTVKHDNVLIGEYRYSLGGAREGDLFHVFWDGSGNDHRIYTVNHETGAHVGYIAAKNTPENDIRSGLRIGNTVLVAGKYVYSYPLGMARNLQQSDRVNSFGAAVHYTDLRIGTDGKIYAQDNNDNFFNITDQKFLFQDDGKMLEAAGKIYVWKNGSPDTINQWEENQEGIWELTDTANISGFNLLDQAVGYLDEKTGKFRILNSDKITEKWKIVDVEAKDYAAGEVYYGRADEQCSRIPALLNPAILSEVRTDAEVTVRWDNGRAWVSGQVIKLILDLLGVKTDNDYMDGITGFKALADGRNYNLNLGGRTFALDEISDDFENVLVPQVVEITALESLWSNRK